MIDRTILRATKTAIEKSMAVLSLINREPIIIGDMEIPPISAEENRIWNLSKVLDKQFSELMSLEDATATAQNLKKFHILSLEYEINFLKFEFENGQFVEHNDICLLNLKLQKIKNS